VYKNETCTTLNYLSVCLSIHCNWSGDGPRVQVASKDESADDAKYSRPDAPGLNVAGI